LGGSGRVKKEGKNKSYPPHQIRVSGVSAFKALAITGKKVIHRTNKGFQGFSPVKH